MQTARDMVKYLPAQIALAVAGFLAVPIITRLFDPAAYGKYILVTTLVRVMILTTGWLSGSVIRFYPEYEIKGNLDDLCSTVVRTVWICIGGISFIYAGALCISIHMADREMYRLLWLGLPLFALTATHDNLLEFLRAKRRLTAYSGFVMWRCFAALSFGILITLLLLARVEALIYGGILCLALVLPILWRRALGNALYLRNPISRALLPQLASYGLPNVISNISAWLLNLSDRYLMNLFRDKAEVGIYAASFSVAEYSLSLITTLIGLTSGTIVFNLWEKEGEAKAKEFMKNITRLYLLISIPATVGLCLLAKPVVALITARQYHDGYRIVPFVVAGAFFLGLQQRYYPGINIMKKNYLITISIFLSALTSIGLNLVFLPAYGYRAAALTMLVSNTFLFVLVMSLSRRHITWPFPFGSLIRALSAAAVMSAAVLWIRDLRPDLRVATVASCGLVGAVIYFAALYFLREIDKADVRRALSVCFAWGSTNWAGR